MSVGDFDFLPDIYNKLGAEVLFNKVAMRPGSVTTVARADDMLLFGLSGNPSACYVGFTLFVKPMIQTWLLNEKPHSGWAEAVLTNDFPKPNPFTRFVRAFVYHKDGKMMASPVGLDKSSSVTSLAEANAFILLREERGGMKRAGRFTCSSSVMRMEVNGRGQFFPDRPDRRFSKQR